MTALVIGILVALAVAGWVAFWVAQDALTEAGERYDALAARHRALTSPGETPAYGATLLAFRERGVEL